MSPNPGPMSLPVSTQDLPECNLVTLVKRTPNGNGEPHVVPVVDVDTIGVRTAFSGVVFAYSLVQTEASSDLAKNI